MPIDVILSSLPGSESPFSLELDDCSTEVIGRFDQLVSLYREGFSNAGATVRVTDAPMIYHSSEARRVIGVNEKSIHIAVRPLQAVRPMYGVRNYLVCDEVNSGTDAVLRRTAATPLDALRQFQGILCTTERVQEQLTALGAKNTRVFPPPFSETALSCRARTDVDLARRIALSPVSSRRSAAVDFADLRSRTEHLIFCSFAPAQTVQHVAREVLRFQRFTGQSCALIVAPATECLLPRHWRRIVMPVFTTPPDLPELDLVSLLHGCDFYVQARVVHSLDLQAFQAACAGMVPVLCEGHSALEVLGDSAVSFRPQQRIGNNIVRGLLTRRRVGGTLSESLMRALELSCRSRTSTASAAVETLREIFSPDGFRQLVSDLTKRP